MASIGPKKWVEQQSTLYELVSDCGVGVMGGEFYDPPSGAIDFCYTQYDRFGIPRPPEEVIYVSAACTYYVVDLYDPYALLCGTSDVLATDDWQDYTYEIIEDNGDVFEANPQTLETYVFTPNQDEWAFQDMLTRPGLQALPYGLGGMIDEHLAEGFLNGAELEEKTKLWLQDQCKGNEEMWMAFFQLSSWAAFLWFAGPLGREFRYQAHDIFNLCKRDGECILYDAAILGKEHYRKLPRPAQSCCVCGLDSWCVDLVHVSGVTRYLCEKHLNGELPLYGRANCGSRFCKYAECPHHPEHGNADARHRILSQRGQLTQLAQPGKEFLSGTARVSLTK